MIRSVLDRTSRPPTDRTMICAPPVIARPLDGRRDRRPRCRRGTDRRRAGIGDLGSDTSPVTAVGTVFIDEFAASLKDLAVAWFGTNDKPALDHRGRGHRHSCSARSWVSRRSAADGSFRWHRACFGAVGAGRSPPTRSARGATHWPCGTGHARRVSRRRSDCSPSPTRLHRQRRPRPLNTDPRIKTDRPAELPVRIGCHGGRRRGGAGVGSAIGGPTTRYRPIADAAAARAIGVGRRTDFGHVRRRRPDARTSLPTPTSTASTPRCGHPASTRRSGHST